MASSFWTFSSAAKRERRGARAAFKHACLDRSVLQRIAPHLWLAVTCALVAISCPLSADQATESAECVNSSIAFDGVTPPTYAAVAPRGGERTYVHHEYPRACDDHNNSSCDHKAYLVKGDTIAIGKTCDDWAYVQFLGPKRVSEGWMSSTDLARLPRESSPAEAKTAGKYIATLGKGNGIPVCEAYLQRLNQTRYELPPFCGRPESTIVPGFAHLDRVRWSTKDTARLFVEANNFINDQPSYGGAPLPFSPSAKLASYGFRALLAIENDGIPQNVVLWNLDNLDHPACNSTFGPIPFPHRSFQVALILSNDGRKIESARTNEVFGQPPAGTPLPGDAEQHMNHEGYAHLGNTYGVFEYRGVFYFDTFFDNGPHALEHIVNEGEPDILENTLGVFLRRGHRTAEICEYRVNQ